MAFCTECGTPLHENENFCRQCGKPIAPPPAPAPQPEKPKKQPKKLGAVRTAISVGLCLLLLVSTLVSVVLWDVRTLVTGDAVVSMVGSYMQDMDLTEIPAQTLIPEVTDPSQSVLDWFIATVADTSEGTIQISDSQVDEFMAKSTIPAFIQEKLGMIAKLLGGAQPQDLITRGELQQLLEENAALAEEIFQFPANDEQIAFFLDSMEEMGIFERYSAENLIDTLDDMVYSMDNTMNFSYLQFLAEVANTWVTVAMVLFILLSVGFAALIALTNRWDFVRTSLFTGIPLTVVGIILVIVACAKDLFSGIWAGLNPELANIAGLYLRTTLVPAIAVLVLGVLLSLVFVTFRLVLPKVRKSV